MAALDPNPILIAEFNYAQQSTFQANEDRVRVLNFLLANVGTFIAAITLPNITKIFGYAFFAVMFVGLFIVGLISLLELIKLRISWIASVKAMNQIKEYYIKHGGHNDLSSAFAWKTNAIPKKNKVWSIAFMIGLTIILINSGAMAAIVILLGLANQTEILYWQSILIAGLALVIQLILWFRL